MGSRACKQILSSRLDIVTRKHPPACKSIGAVLPHYGLLNAAAKSLKLQKSRFSLLQVPEKFFRLND